MKVFKLFIDTETTGLSAYKNGIWQLAGVLDEGEHIPGTGCIREFNYKMRPLPTDKIDQKALEIGGITNRDLDNFEYSSAKALEEFKLLLGNYVEPFNPMDKMHFIAYNAKFDQDFIRQWFRKLGDRYFGSWFWTPTIDVMVLAGQYLMDERPKLPDFKLGTVAKYLGVEIETDKQHDALYDAKLTREIYLKVTQKGETK